MTTKNNRWQFEAKFRRGWITTRAFEKNIYICT
jgi:hypothetical protein